MRILSAMAIVLAASLPVSANNHWPQPTDVITPHATGLHIETADGTPRDGLPFGSPFHVTMHRLVGTFGHDVTVGFPQECGEGPLVSVTIPNQISLMFQEDRFAGWMLIGDATLRTTTGLGVGSARADLSAEGHVSFFESGIGTEFGAGALFGLLTETGSEVQAVWAGATCIFR